MYCLQLQATDKSSEGVKVNDIKKLAGSQLYQPVAITHYEISSSAATIC